MDEITSIHNEKIKELAKLHEKKYRDESNLFLVEGEHLVEEAYKKNQLVEIYSLKEYICDFDIKNTIVSEAVMKKLSLMPSIPKVIGVCKKFNPLGYQNRIIVLDNLQDPGNLGTIIRSAVSFNFNTIILSENCVDLYNDKVIRASQGMIFNIDIIRRDIYELLKELKDNNYVIYGSKVDGGKAINEVTFSKKCAIVIGNEGSGISDVSKSLVDENLYIPMNKMCESLNASVAASIIMYEMSKIDYE